MRVLIVGCGYVGMPLGQALLRAGHDVVGIRRSAEGAGEMRAAGIKPLALDIARAEELARIEPDFDWVVNLVSSSKGGAAEYERVYLEGTRCLVRWLESSRVRKFVYTSSTSVYPQADSSIVDEHSPANPSTETGRTLVKTEQVLLNASREKQFPAVILRVAGIYGPGRGHLFEQFLRGEAKVHGVGNRLLNMIHVEDLIGAIIAALQRGEPGEIYNVTDNEAVAEGEFLAWLARETGRPMPPRAQPGLLAGRKRGLTSKRVSNLKARTNLAWELAFPTFREGYAPRLEILKKN